MPASSFELFVVASLPAILSSWLIFRSREGGELSYFQHWVIFMFLDAAYGHLFHLMLVIPARWIAVYCLPGSKLPPLTDEKLLREQEEESNDASLVWPSPVIIAKLPDDWKIDGASKVSKEVTGGAQPDVKSDNVITLKSIDAAARKRRKKKSSQRKDEKKAPAATNSSQDLPEQSSRSKQPYYLNHVRGSTRIRQASQRIAAAFGTLAASLLLSHYSSLITLDDIGLVFPSTGRLLSDLVTGFCIGSFIVIFIFMIELRLGWIRIIGFKETVVESESFINILWDILFHVGVSINEEVMLRGWMFSLGCKGIQAMTREFINDPTTAATFAIGASVVLQSTLFAVMHLHSPGSTAISQLNLFLGGIAASLNVMATGGSLWMGIGWHFGWNIFMGHILGRSTSGIPMSCAGISVLPKPSYEKFHGGTFGPEQGVLAPLAYTLGMALVIWVYGWEELWSWRDRIIL